MRRVPVLLLAALLAGGCFPRASVPDEERERASRELEGQQRYLKVAAYLGPFFGDSGKLLLSDQPFGELDLLQTTDGRPIEPPPAERVLAPGARLRVEKVEFPTGWLIAKRVVMTPRYHPWVYLQLDGEPRPLIVVLPQTLSSAEEVRIELERVLGKADPAPVFAGLPDAQRAAVARKQLADDMPPPVVEMAWGYPEKKVIDRPAGTEEWSWPGGRRKAFFSGGKLARWEPTR